ncbi:MAG TPA: DUF2259 domain-containing protein [Spirochaetia bacterium]|nr:DUF2259 domain-containing protein [Spirochaetia bacterium]
MTKRWALLGALMLFSHVVFAGDVANFINLGFSPDAKYFLFGEYGVNDNSNPYADIFGVNVSRNTFVPDGVESKTYSSEAGVGQDGMGALFTLFADYVPISKRYKIDHMLSGRDLYLLVNGEQPKPRLDFRDFVSNDQYIVTLNQFTYGSGQSVSSSFSIDLTIHSSKGTNLHYTVGLPNYHRPGVENYRIRKIILAPDKRSLVFIIEKHVRDKSGINVRFMVETVRTDL